MRKISTTILSILLCLASNIAWSADFKKGLAALDTGDYATALREWRPLAEQVNSDAQNRLGIMYDTGKVIPQDHKIALKWFRLSTRQGYGAAQSNLGDMYDNGNGVSQDYETALKWFKLAAKQGFAPAQTNLGGMYHNGYVV